MLDEFVSVKTEQPLELREKLNWKVRLSYKVIVEICNWKAKTEFLLVKTRPLYAIS